MSWIFGGDWDRAVSEIEARLAWNEFKWYELEFWYANPTTRRAHVESILNSYTNLVIEDKSQPEFYDEWKMKQGDAAMSALLNKVAEISGAHNDVTRRVMDHLVWATKDGSIKSNRIWKPRLTAYNEMRDKTPEKADSMWNSPALQGLSFLTNNLDTIIPVALIGTGLFIMFPYISAARSAAKAHSGKN